MVLFLYFGCARSSLMFGLFSAYGERTCFFIACTGFSMHWLSCGMRALGMWAQKLRFLGSRAQVQQLWHTDLVAPRQVGSSQTRIKHALAGGFPTTGATRKVPTGSFDGRLLRHSLVESKVTWPAPL